MNFHAALPYHAASDERLGSAEAGAINQYIDRALDAIARDDAVRTPLGDPFRNQFDVRTIECWIVVVGNKDTFAAQQIVGRECRAHPGIFNIPGEMAARDSLDHLAESIVAEKAEDAELLTPEKKLAQGPAGDGGPTQTTAPLFAECQIHPPHHPRTTA